MVHRGGEEMGPAAAEIAKQGQADWAALLDDYKAAARRWSDTDHSAASPCSSLFSALSRGRCLMSSARRRAVSVSRCQSSRSVP